MNFTFKKHIAVGRYSSFELDQTEIKLKKQQVGIIYETREHLYKIRFAIKKEKTTEDPADFKWIILKGKFNTEEKARGIIKKFSKEIQEKYDLYFFEKEA